MDHEAKWQRELAALLSAGLDPAVLMPSYFDETGGSGFELEAHLLGALTLPAPEQGSGLGGTNPLVGKSTSQGLRRRQKPSGEDALAALGAAGGFMLSPVRAEAERLTSLHETGLLSTGPEETYDRVVYAAKAFFNVGAASLSLIDAKSQYLKSVVGPLQYETSRDIALCDHTVRHNAMFVVNDTRADERFASNPLVVGEPHIRFYAGFPLSGPRGWNIGTLCIIDHEPRTFSPSDQKVLRAFALIVQNDINARTLRS